jgi:hypothetical protein
MNKDLYPDDPVKREDVYNTYKKYLGNVSHFVRSHSSHCEVFLICDTT